MMASTPLRSYQSSYSHALHSTSDDDESPSYTVEKYARLDRNYNKQLNDLTYVKKMSYRSAVIHFLGDHLRYLDHLEIGEMDRKAAGCRYQKVKNALEKTPVEATSMSQLPLKIASVEYKVQVSRAGSRLPFKGESSSRRLENNVGDMEAERESAFTPVSTAPKATSPNGRPVWQDQPEQAAMPRSKIEPVEDMEAISLAPFVPSVKAANEGAPAAAPAGSTVFWIDWSDKPTTTNKGSSARANGPAATPQVVKHDDQALLIPDRFKQYSRQPRPLQSRSERPTATRSVVKQQDGSAARTKPITKVASTRYDDRLLVSRWHQGRQAALNRPGMKSTQTHLVSRCVVYSSTGSKMILTHRGN
jgi:hypothetical protein